MQPKRDSGQGDEKREDEAGDTRSGRPNPEEDAGERTTTHKGGYGGEHGEPRPRPGGKPAA